MEEQDKQEASDEQGALIRVMALHALLYCERLFYLEEVEEIRVADAAVWAGRRLHEELNEDGEVETLTLESESFGIRGRLDAFRARDGKVYPIEHKRGRSMRDRQDQPHAWESDYVQAVAYAMLLEEHLGRPVVEARVRYHKDNALVKIPITGVDKDMVLRAVKSARALTTSVERPPVQENPNKCMRCSLAPVCLPEEARLAKALVPSEEDEEQERPTPVRLFPPDSERRSLHVMTHGAQVGMRQGRFRVMMGKEVLDSVPSHVVSDVVLHGYAQITTQALRACASDEIPVHWMTSAGAWAGSFYGPQHSVQRKIRQYEALTDEGRCLGLATSLILAKIDHQLKLVLRSSRGDAGSREAVGASLGTIREALRGARRAERREALLGWEGLAAKGYFSALGALVHPDDEESVMRPRGRSRRPPKDRFNALLSFGYGLLYRDVLAQVLAVGLEPSFGFYHRPRSSAPPLALDLMELWRVPVVDMAVLAAVNRRTFDVVEDFQVTGPQVWLSEQGRRKLIEIYERRKHEEYKHPVLEYSLSYARMMELEVRLLEKEWAGEPGLFAQFRFR